MAKTAIKTSKKATSVTVEDKLKALYQLQCVDSEIDSIRVVRGELPLEIQDLEDAEFSKKILRFFVARKKLNIKKEQ